MRIAICRLFGAIAAGVARKVVGPGLHPIQTGGGLRCGVEFASRMTDLAYRQEDDIIAVDLRNAFNTIRHRPRFDAIMERHHPIARLLHTVFYNYFKQCHHQSFSAEFLYRAFRDSCNNLLLSL